MDESKKQSLMMGIVAFNLTIIVYQFAFNMGQNFSMLKLLLGVLIAAAIGAGALLGTRLLSK